MLIEILRTLKLAPGPVGQHYQHLLRANGKPKARRRRGAQFCTHWATPFAYSSCPATDLGA